MTSLLAAAGIVWLLIFFARLSMGKKIRTFDEPHQEGNVVDMMQYRKKR